MTRKHDGYHYGTPGADTFAYGAAPVVKRPAPTVTGQVGGFVNLAARPVKWAFHTAGGLVGWIGNTLDSIGNKL